MNLRSPKQNSVSFKDNFKINLEKEVVSNSLRKSRSKCQESTINENLIVFNIIINSLIEISDIWKRILKIVKDMFSSLNRILIVFLDLQLNMKEMEM